MRVRRLRSTPSGSQIVRVLAVRASQLYDSTPRMCCTSRHRDSRIITHRPIVELIVNPLPPATVSPTATPPSPQPPSSDGSLGSLKGGSALGVGVLIGAVGTLGIAALVFRLRRDKSVVATTATTTQQSSNAVRNPLASGQAAVPWSPSDYASPPPRRV